MDRTEAWNFDIDLFSFLYWRLTSILLRELSVQFRFFGDFWICSTIGNRKSLWQIIVNSFSRLFGQWLFGFTEDPWDQKKFFLGILGNVVLSKIDFKLLRFSWSSGCSSKAKEENRHIPALPEIFTLQVMMTLSRF